MGADQRPWRRSARRNHRSLHRRTDERLLSERPPLRNVVRGIVFDAHGTLIEYDEDHALAYFAQIADDQGLAVEPAAFWQAWLDEGEAFAKERGLSWTTLDGPLPELEPFRVTWPIQFGRTFASLNVDGDSEAASKDLRRRFAESAVYDDVPEALALLRETGLPLSVLSNADHDFLLPPLESNGLVFDYVDSSETAKAYKPHRRAFEHAAERVGIELSALLYVGDSPISDLTGAHHAGMRVAWMNRRGVPLPEGTPAPDLVISSLADLVPHLARPAG